MTTPTTTNREDGASVDPAVGPTVEVPSASGLPSRWISSAIGVLAGAAALGTGELVAGLRASWQSPVVAVAEAVIDRVPRALKDFAVETFGTSDKVALVVGILTFSLVFAAVLGLVARWSRRAAAGGFVAFAAVGAWASQQATGATLDAALPSVAAGFAGVATLWFLTAPQIAPASRRHRAEQPGAGSPSSVPPQPATGQPSPDATKGGGSRRTFLLASGAIAATAAVFAAGGRALRSRFSAAESRAAVTLPVPSAVLPPAPTSVSADVPGVSSFFTPNADFYRIDTALTVPQVLAEGWSLRLTGMVDRELSFSYDDLLQRGVVEEDITLTCVSNTVGGKLIGTARWLGVPLADLLAEAGVDPAADQLVGRSVDGYSCGLPLAAVADGRPALVAVGMNGEPLPLEHGFPARLIVSGLYGYVSATKWLTELEVTTFDAFDQYWVVREWDAQAPIKTMARIDTPRTIGSSPAGTVAVAGVAWAQTLGISKVEVSIDDAEFAEAQLADELNVHTWRQWSYAWNDATPGRHRITVRATDSNGELQTDVRADPFPNGASGWMSIFVDVEEAA